jgi:hypothetical protein
VKPPAVYDRYKAEKGFVESHDRLALELCLGTPRRHLDILVELCEVYLRECGDTELAANFRERLDRSKRVIEVRHVLVNTREAAND